MTTERARWEMSEWRPIATVPKDGRKVLVGRFVKRCQHGHNGRVEVDRWRDGKPWLGFGRFNAEFWPPTHWMPLPEPPQIRVELAERLWEEAEIRRLSSPWTTPTRFEGKVREHFMRKARASGGQHD